MAEDRSQFEYMLLHGFDSLNSKDGIRVYGGLIFAMKREEAERMFFDRLDGNPMLLKKVNLIHELKAGGSYFVLARSERKFMEDSKFVPRWHGDHFLYRDLGKTIMKYSREGYSDVFIGIEQKVLPY